MHLHKEGCDTWLIERSNLPLLVVDGNFRDEQRRQTPRHTFRVTMWVGRRIHLPDVNTGWIGRATNQEPQQ